MKDVIIIIREAEAPYPCDTAYFCLPTSLRLPQTRELGLTGRRTSYEVTHAAAWRRPQVTHSPAGLSGCWATRRLCKCVMSVRALA